MNFFSDTDKDDTINDNNNNNNENRAQGSINILKYAVYKTTIAIKMRLNIRIGYHRK